MATIVETCSYYRFNYNIFIPWFIGYHASVRYIPQTNHSYARKRICCTSQFAGRIECDCEPLFLLLGKCSRPWALLASALTPIPISLKVILSSRVDSRPAKVNPTSDGSSLMATSLRYCCWFFVIHQYHQVCDHSLGMEPWSGRFKHQIMWL